MKTLFLSLAFISIVSLNSNAQVLEKTRQAINSFQNISYEDALMFKWSTDEKPANQRCYVYLKPLAAELQTGGYYKIINGSITYCFDGNKLLELETNDKTYQIFNDAEYGQPTHTLIYIATQIKKALDHPEKIQIQADTLISGNNYSHVDLTLYDKMENNVRCYTIAHLIIDKKTNLPYLLKMTSLGMMGDRPVGLLEEHRFTNLKFNVKNFPELSPFAIPDNYKAWARKEVAPLTIGTKAPTLKLYDLKGKPFAFEQLKGKTVLLSFNLVGCPHCIDAEVVLKKIQKKYQGSDVMIAILYPIDQAKAVIKHNATFDISIPSFTTDKKLEQTYSYHGYPSFYVIDKQGNIAGSYPGYSDDLEKQLTNIIDKVGTPN